jgi:small subunit ribosomal protein S18
MPSRKGKPRSDGKRSRPFDPSRRRFCHFCKEHVDQIDYKETQALRRCISERGKIKSRRVTGTCRRHQRQVAIAIKRSREMALLPYTSSGVEVREGGGRGRRR